MEWRQCCGLLTILISVVLLLLGSWIPTTGRKLDSVANTTFIETTTLQDSIHNPSLVYTRNETTAHFFWSGGPLKRLPMACINSFVQQGFVVVVWTYESNLVVPQNASIGRASEILPESTRYKITHGGVRGSFASLSDLLRYRVLLQFGGWWVDSDMFCLRPVADFIQLIDGRPAIVGLQNTNEINGAILYFHNSSVAGLLELRAMETLERFKWRIPWAHIGPILLSSVVGEELNLLSQALPPCVFYPIPWVEWKRPFTTVDFRTMSALTSRSHTYHVWNELSKGTVVQPKSFMDALLRKYDVNK